MYESIYEYIEGYLSLSKHTTIINSNVLANQSRPSSIRCLNYVETYPDYITKTSTFNATLSNCITERTSGPSF